MRGMLAAQRSKGIRITPHRKQRVNVRFRRRRRHKTFRQQVGSGRADFLVRLKHVRQDNTEVFHLADFILRNSGHAVAVFLHRNESVDFAEVGFQIAMSHQNIRRSHRLRGNVRSRFHNARNLLRLITAQRTVHLPQQSQRYRLAHRVFGRAARKKLVRRGFQNADFDRFETFTGLLAQQTDSFIQNRIFMSV